MGGYSSSVGDRMNHNNNCYRNNFYRIGKGNEVVDNHNYPNYNHNWMMIQLHW